MSKSILIIDTPESCLECPFRYNDGYSSEYKSTWFTRRCYLSHDQVYENEILENCPLKPMPQKKNTDMSFSTMDEWLEYSERIGYNFCIDEILGNGNETNI